jgi:hypothetical protein
MGDEDMVDGMVVGVDGVKTGDWVRAKECVMREQ